MEPDDDQAHMILRRALIVAIVLLGALACAPNAQAGGPYDHSGGVAISGYDPVAYFTDGAAVAGNPDIALRWQGAIWYFASAENRLRFEGNPLAYAPQYGGFCALDMARGQAVRSDPRVWMTANGRLYLNATPQMNAAWQSDLAANVAAANANWPDAAR